MHPESSRLEPLFRDLFEHAGDAQLLLDQNRFVDCNAAALQLLGFKEKIQLLERHPVHLSPEFQPDGQRSSDKAQQLIQAALQGDNQRFEWLHRRIDGSDIWVEVLLTAMPWRDQPMLHVTWRDIDQRKQSEIAMRQAASVFENAQEGVTITDAEERILRVNRAFCELTGYSEEEVIGQTPRFLQSGRHNLDFYVAMWASIHATGHWRGEIWNRRKNGEVYPELLSISAIKGETGQVTHYVALFSDISLIKSSEQQVHFLAYYDALTRLPNRMLLAQQAELALEVATRHGSGLAILFIDLDRFREVNNALGHTEGDALLIQVAERFQQYTRATDTACRLGSDKFALLLPGADQRSALHVAEKILMAFRQPFLLAGHQLRITVSIGIALHPHDGQIVAELLKNADAALYQAKQDGRNTLAFYSREMNVATFERLMMESELRNAIAAGQLRAHYQAKIDLRNGQIVGAEALVRWRHPLRGLVPPGQFIPLAEASDLIVELGDWMLEEVCQQLATWRDAGLPLLTVAVNLAARHFRTPGLAARIQTLLLAYDLPASALELELTESTLLETRSQVTETLLALEQLGIGLAIDDFGTGYSSLSYLKRLPITALKIDQSFVRDLSSDPDGRILAATIVNLGHSLQLKVVAEGGGDR
jgi:diguanylate cyclase (GGDEF)-like protein/PAS domain S-box-containing protein